MGTCLEYQFPGIEQRNISQISLAFRGEMRLITNQSDFPIAERDHLRCQEVMNF